jgi:hypothetical protein
MFDVRYELVHKRSFFQKSGFPVPSLGSFSCTGSWSAGVDSSKISPRGNVGRANCRIVKECRMPPATQRKRRAASGSEHPTMYAQDFKIKKWPPTDWVLVYKIDGDRIVFERIGSHSDLFRK